jgi:hypothetical protein
MLVFTVTEPNSNRPSSVMKLPLHTPTAWRIKNKQDEFYTLGSLWCTIENRKMKFSEFDRELRRIGLPLVNILERNPIVSFFTGVTDNSNQIDIMMRS